MVVLKLDGLTRKGIGEMIDRVKSAGERLHLTQNVNISDILKEGSVMCLFMGHVCSIFIILLSHRETRGQAFGFI